MSINLKQNFSEGYELFTQWTFPLDYCFQKAKKKAIEYPRLSVVLVAITSFFLGFSRLITFPLLCTIGIISMPFIALTQKIQNKNASKWLIAFGLSLLSLAIILSTLFSSIIFAPAPIIFTIFATTIFISISITCVQINHSLYKNNNLFIKN